MNDAERKRERFSHYMRGVILCRKLSGWVEVPTADPRVSEWKRFPLLTEKITRTETA